MYPNKSNIYFHILCFESFFCIRFAISVVFYVFYKFFSAVGVSGKDYIVFVFNFLIVYIFDGLSLEFI